MQEIKSELESVYKLISGLTVSGDNVDIVAAVRAKLRKIYADIDKIPVELKKTETEEVEEDGH